MFFRREKCSGEKTEKQKEPIEEEMVSLKLKWKWLLAHKIRKTLIKSLKRKLLESWQVLHSPGVH